MVIGQSLKHLRVQKNMSQGDIEKRTGLLRCYISRVENGHPVPAILTLERMARALGPALSYQLCCFQAVESRHTQIQQDHAGLKLKNFPDTLRPIGSLAANRHAVMPLRSRSIQYAGDMSHFCKFM